MRYCICIITRAHVVYMCVYVTGIEHFIIDRSLFTHANMADPNIAAFVENLVILK